MRGVLGRHVAGEHDGHAADDVGQLAVELTHAPQR
jgi:hypothetical protein